MTIRNIYFVRHGQTDANVGHLAQGPNSTLTSEGERQAQKVGERLRDISFDLIITSPYKRAQQTAGLIKEYSGHESEIEVVEALHERVKPEHLTGIPSSSLEYQSYITDIITHAADPNFRVGDAENFSDMLTRAQELLAYIAHDTQGDVVAVSHGYFLRIVIGYILTESENLDMYASSVVRNLYLENTGITHVRLDEQGHWHFGSINDSTHLS